MIYKNVFIKKNQFFLILKILFSTKFFNLSVCTHIIVDCTKMGRALPTYANYYFFLLISDNWSGIYMICLICLLWFHKRVMLSNSTDHPVLNKSKSAFENLAQLWHLLFLISPHIPHKLLFLLWVKNQNVGVIKFFY